VLDGQETVSGMAAVLRVDRSTLHRSLRRMENYRAKLEARMKAL